MSLERTSRIRALNDEFRGSLVSVGRILTMLATGRLIATPGVVALGDSLTQAVAAVRSYNDFDEDNDPYGEHDFGSFEIDGQKLFWKIDYYDTDLEYGSEDPSNPDVTRRVLTILLASEY